MKRQIAIFGFMIIANVVIAQDVVKYNVIYTFKYVRDLENKDVRHANYGFELFKEIKYKVSLSKNDNIADKIIEFKLFQPEYLIYNYWNSFFFSEKLLQAFASDTSFRILVASTNESTFSPRIP